MSQTVGIRNNERILVSKNQWIVSEVIQSLKSFVVDVCVGSSMPVQYFESHQVSHHWHSQISECFIQLDECHQGVVCLWEILTGDIFFSPHFVFPIFVDFSSGFNNLLLQRSEFFVRDPTLMENARNFWFRGKLPFQQVQTCCVDVHSPEHRTTSGKKIVFQTFSVQRVVCYFFINQLWFFAPILSIIQSAFEQSLICRERCYWNFRVAFFMKISFFSLASRTLNCHFEQRKNKNVFALIEFLFSG